MKENIFIPKKCKVGFNERADTYTGMLGYVIYFDGKKWRKEPSWESWRTKYISEEEWERQKLNSYNNHIDGLFRRVENGSVEVYGYPRRTLTGITCKEDLMREEPYEKYKYSNRGQSHNEKIKPLEFDNEPMEGFVLNKKAGGDKYGWNPRQTYCRVYDPRGFEFEITIPNLLYILENTNSIKGKGLEGKFVYGWHGKDLVLVPENAPEYEEMMKFTTLQDGKVLKKDLVLGKMYTNSQGEKLIYIGEAYELDWSGYPTSKKRLWFAYEDYKKDWNPAKTYAGASSIKGEIGDMRHELANILDRMEKYDKYYSGEIQYEKVPDPKTYLLLNLGKRDGYYRNETQGLYIQLLDGKFIQAHVAYGYDHGTYGYRNNDKMVYSISLKDRRETFDTVDELINKYDLWQLKTTK